ncbi:Smc5-Smc6 complex subunit NSE5 CYBJADRAFT_170871 [Cyberlindnera jadinii NRRL Y-1542]|uniref:Uncharacterized protein n=1 Tax=Cyberlindnera jadinii (strain ATCC 18201 / CBS 1600 / BCRC 20928 / JCM 3617 / NBRC 0987 / NRRL Y-1542) TaxID=983966 RepID=A0A1E4SA74_CYBJN|nr:hypothetical protein CYBJADRAFT_170871 [Cyberlindnera jadinii NRRL Y-1542]ODV76427.1 hypothetical protein CYBJADRAFT_170871 [Cyberlindnera jadinii NRRL Y-1542]
MNKSTDELLESYISVQQWDMLLTKLETESFFCPSAFVLDVLFTLATISTYNNETFIAQKFGIQTSDRPINQRALWILESIVHAVIQSSVATNHGDGENNLFSFTLDSPTLVYSRKQLIQSLDFIRNRGLHNLRSKAMKKALYSENNDLFDEITTSPVRKKLKSEEFGKNDSPQKRALKLALQPEDSPMDDVDLQDEAENRTLAVLNRERIDVALAEGRIWSAISWCLFNAHDVEDPLKQAIANMWTPILSLFIKIMELEMDEYSHEIAPNDEYRSEFTELVTTKFFGQVGHYSWSTKLIEAIFPVTDDKQRHRVEKIFANETRIAKGQYLVPSPHGTFTLAPKLVSPDSVSLRKSILKLANNWLNQGGEGKFSKCSVDDLISSCSIYLFNGNIDDYLLFFRLDPDGESEENVSLLGQILICSLVQISTHTFDQPESDWFTSKGSITFIQELLELTTYKKKYYNFETSEGFERMVTDFSRINIILFTLFSIWYKFSKLEMTETQKDKLLHLAQTGESNRLAALEGCKREFKEEQLIYISDLLKSVLHGI